MENNTLESVLSEMKEVRNTKGNLIIQKKKLNWQKEPCGCDKETYFELYYFYWGPGVDGLYSRYKRRLRA